MHPPAGRSVRRGSGTPPRGNRAGPRRSPGRRGRKIVRACWRSGNSGGASWSLPVAMIAVAHHRAAGAATGSCAGQAGCCPYLTRQHGAYPRRMGIEVLPAAGRWDDFASFMVPRKPGGRDASASRTAIPASRCPAVSRTCVRCASASRAPASWRTSMARSPAGARSRRSPLTVPCQLADDPPCPGRGRVAGGLLRGAAGVPAARTHAPAAGRRGRARARDGRDRGGRLPGRPWQRAHRPDQRLRGHRPALRAHSFKRVRQTAGRRGGKPRWLVRRELP